MKHCKQAFTLIELLVVICIIAILASMLLPALQSARESASTATCIGNLGQFSKAYQMYATSYNDFLPALTDGQSGSSCSWEDALIMAIGQDPNKNPPFKKSFFCESDASSETASAGGNKKSYSLNNLQEAVHPLIPSILGPKGKTSTKDGNLGYISGNKTTSIFTASDLIIIGENSSASNNWGKASFSKNSANADSAGSASGILQQVQIRPKRLTSHNTAGELFLDGHARHLKPQQTMPTKEDGKVNNTFFIENKITYNEVDNNKKLASTAWGSWTDCPLRKGGQDCSDPGSCHKR